MLREIVDDIVSGPGYRVIKAYHDSTDIDYALRFVRRATNGAPEHVLERRAWNLQDKHDRLRRLAEPAIACQAFDIILGRKQKLNSFGANRLMPGAQAQEPHVDFPYWGLFDPNNMPLNFNASFAMACQTLSPLTAFNQQNGAIEIVPHTQKSCSYPTSTEFERDKICLELEPGDLVLYHSLLWHRAGHNRSPEDRIALLGQHTAYFIGSMM